MLGLSMRAVVVAAVTQRVSLAQGPSAPARQAADSARVVRAARGAQTSFEAFRRSRLPFGFGGTSPCDVRIGRYCYWRGDDDDETPLPEKPAVKERRSELIALLDTAAHAATADAWMAGQFVRYLVEADRADEAMAFARRDCRATASWCAALAGLAAHSGGRFAAADSEFTNALAAMDPDERRRWLDIDELIEDPIHDRFKALGTGERERFVRRLMWIGAPLLSVSGTDLFTEHLARVTRARIGDDAATTEGGSWSDDDRRLTVRYGWPKWFTQTRTDFGSMRGPSIVGHDVGVPYDFLPSARVLEHVGLASAEDWHLDDPRARTGYAPRYARSVHEIPHQIALFRRGDSTLAVAAWDARRDTTLIGRSLDAALVIAASPDHRTIARRSDAHAFGRIAVTGLIDSGLVSLEVLAAADRRAGRARVGVPARTDASIALSDLLLYSPTAEAPYSLDVVRDSAMASDILPMSRAVGVFWEAYGLAAASEPVHFTLTLEQVNVSWVRQLAEQLRFADPTTALRIQWDEVPLMTNGIAGRGVRVDLSQLRAGRYRMQLSVEAVGRPAARAEREVEIR